MTPLGRDDAALGLVDEAWLAGRRRLLATIIIGLLLLRVLD